MILCWIVGIVHPPHAVAWSKKQGWILLQLLKLCYCQHHWGCIISVLDDSLVLHSGVENVPSCYKVLPSNIFRERLSTSAMSYVDFTKIWIKTSKKCLVSEVHLEPFIIRSVGIPILILKAMFSLELVGSGINAPPLLFHGPNEPTCTLLALL